MNKEDRKRFEEIKNKLSKDLPYMAVHSDDYLADGNFLIRVVEEAEARSKGLEIKLRAADVLAMAIDVAVAERSLNSRTLIADARLDYGEPWNYEFAKKEQLSRYKEGTEKAIAQKYIKKFLL